MTVPTANPPSYPLASIVSIKRALDQLFYPGQERPGISNDRFGSKTEVSGLVRHVRFTLRSGRRQPVPACPFGANMRHRPVWAFQATRCTNRV
jgi:hypothetical protein